MNSLKKFDFCATGSLIPIFFFVLFKDHVSFLEIVYFLGSERWFFSLIPSFFFFFFSLAAKLIGPFPGCEFFKNVDFFGYHPLNFNFLY